MNASYAAQGAFGASSATGSLTVNPAATTAGINAPAVTSPANGVVTVTIASTAGTPTGDVSLSVDGGAATTQPLDATGAATFTLTSPTVGTHSLSASYAAQGNFAASNATGSLVVNPAAANATTTSITAPAVTFPASGSVTVSVTSAAGTPTGNVSLSVDGGAPATAALGPAGTAIFTLTNPAAGIHTLSASYAAQGGFGASSATGTLTVNPAATTASITAPVVTSPANGLVTVTISSVAGNPTGNVSLSVDGNAPATLPLGAGGSAVFTILSPAVGTHTLSASYPAQGNFAASSATGTLVVSAAAPNATTVSINAPAVTYPANGLVTVTVSSPAGTPTGSVSLSVDGGAALTSTLGGGSATFTLNRPAAGTHALSASYAAQNGFGAGSATGTLVVNPAVTSMTISAPPVTFPDSGVVTVTVSSTAGIPAGNVSLTVNGSTLALALVKGSATFTVPSLPVGSYPLTAAYAGSGNFGPSGAGANLVVNPEALAITAAVAKLTNKATATWNVSGTTTQPNRNTITVALGSRVIGTAKVSRKGTWTLSVNASAIVPVTGDVVVASSTYTPASPPFTVTIR